MLPNKTLNPTHGSGWFFSDPFYTNLKAMPLNPTHGSGWFLQILSTSPSQHGGIPPTVVGGLFKSFSSKDLKYPPTAVGGITLNSGDVCRKDLNQSTHCRGWDCAKPHSWVGLCKVAPWVGLCKAATCVGVGFFVQCHYFIPLNVRCISPHTPATPDECDRPGCAMHWERSLTPQPISSARRLLSVPQLHSTSGVNTGFLR